MSHRLSWISLVAACGAPLSGSAGPVEVFGRASSSVVCHRNGGGVVSELLVAAPAVPAHLGHGDTLPDRWFGDADGDGFGDPATSTVACAPPAGTVADDTDCDDGDPAVNPAAGEVAGDGIDQDCDGIDPFGGSCPVSSPDRSALHADALIASGDGWTEGLVAADLVGDDADELVVGNALDSMYGTEAGTVRIFAPSLTSDLGLGDAVATIHGTAPYDRLSFAAAGDVDADGRSDLVLGAYGDGDASGTATVHLVVGPLSGVTGADVSATTWSSPSTGQFGTGLGQPVAVLGDVSGDGVVDVGAGDAYGSGNLGRVYAFSGADRGGLAASGAAAVRTGAARQFLQSVAGLDLDHDGVSDLVTGGVVDRAYVDYGPVTGTRSTGAMVTQLVGRGDGVGYRLALGGDVDGDGFEDLLVMEPNASDLVADGGGAYVVTEAAPGVVDLPATAYLRIRGDVAGQQLGTRLVALGDVDGDGYGDIAVASITVDACGADSGAVYLVSGRPGVVLASDADARFVGEPGQRFGAMLAAGDFDGDGVMDLAVGDAPLSGASTTVHLFAGPLF